MNRTRTLPPNVLQQFIITANKEVGKNELAQLINEPTLLDVDAVSNYTEQQAAENYAEIQRRLRVYYGRGARGILLRIGQNLWQSILQEGGFSARILAGFIKVLPTGMRQKSVLDLLARLLRGKEGKVSVHTMDTYLIFAYGSSPTATGQHETQPVCFLTLGLIHGALFWATGKDHEVEETGCCATGGNDCEFKVIISGN